MKQWVVILWLQRGKQPTRVQCKNGIIIPLESSGSLVAVHTRRSRCVPSLVQLERLKAERETELGEFVTCAEIHGPATAQPFRYHGSDLARAVDVCSSVAKTANLESAKVDFGTIAETLSPNTGRVSQSIAETLSMTCK